MNFMKYLADWKQPSMLLLALASLRIAERSLHVAFKGFRAGYVPLGILRVTSYVTGTLRRLSLRCWDVSRSPPPRAAGDSERRKPLPECLTRLLKESSGATTHTAARH